MRFIPLDTSPVSATSPLSLMLAGQPETLALSAPLTTALTFQVIRLPLSSRRASVSVFFQGEPLSVTGTVVVPFVNVTVTAVPASGSELQATLTGISIV